MTEDGFAYIDKRDANSILNIPTRLGARRSLTDSALGMILLAFSEESAQERFLEKRIKLKLDRARKNGHYIDRGEMIEGVVGIGVPFRDNAGRLVAALGAYLPEFQAGLKIENVVKLPKNVPMVISSGIDGNV